MADKTLVFIQEENPILYHITDRKNLQTILQTDYSQVSV